MDLRHYLEYTNLSPVATVKDIDQTVAEATDLGLCGICIPPFWIKRARREIGSSNLTLVTVVGFPFGYQMTETKQQEIALAIDNGADEIDLVWNISSFKTGMPWTKIELAKCSKLVHDKGKIIKIIIETGYLSEAEVVRACKMCSDAGADFVKTSTGVTTAGATKEIVSLMKKALPSTVGIKASGGIKAYQQAVDLIQAGADRIGTSSAKEIIIQSNQKKNGR